MTLEPCTHHGHASAAQSRLCDAVRKARPIVRPWSRDGRHAALLSAVVRTDSMYTIGALTAPHETPPDRPNARLIALVRKALATRLVRFEHVKGHSGVAGNERADKLAGLARLRVPATITTAAEAAS